MAKPLYVIPANRMLTVILKTCFWRLFCKRVFWSGFVPVNPHKINICSGSGGTQKHLKITREHSFLTTRNRVWSAMGQVRRSLISCGFAAPVLRKFSFPSCSFLAILQTSNYRFLPNNRLKIHGSVSKWS